MTAANPAGSKAAEEENAADVFMHCFGSQYPLVSAFQWAANKSQLAVLPSNCCMPSLDCVALPRDCVALPRDCVALPRDCVVHYISLTVSVSCSKPG